MVRGVRLLESGRFETVVPPSPPVSLRLSEPGEMVLSPRLEPVFAPVRAGDRREPLLRPEEVTGLVARLKTVFAAVASRLERSTTGRMEGCSARRLT